MAGGRRRLTIDGVPAGELGRRWGVPACKVERRVGSVLDAVHALGARGEPAGTIVLAEEQTAGRGRDGRTWHSPVGGVWLGLLLRPTADAVAVMSLRVGLAVAEAVDAVVAAAAPGARLKWPNDVLVADRKVAGILCEARWQGGTPQWLAVGLGVNVANDVPAELADRAAALRAFRPDARRIDLLDHLVPTLARRTARGAPLSDRELEEYANRDWLRGRLLRAPVPGRAAGVDAAGALLVDTGAGTAVVRDGHVGLS